MKYHTMSTFDRGLMMGMRIEGATYKTISE